MKGAREAQEKVSGDGIAMKESYVTCFLSYVASSNNMCVPSEEGNPSILLPHSSLPFEVWQHAHIPAQL